MFVNHFFELNKHTVKTLKSMSPRFGYNGFGEFLFYRTYARNKPDGSVESWADCVIRVINGVFSIRKDWYIRNHIKWDETYWQDYAEHMAISMFKMEWLPPGRGLFAMGTQYVYERGSMALYNCAYTDINDDIAESCSWAMDCLMNGVGVGFSPTRNDKIKAYMPTTKTIDYIIPDTREGWCESVSQLIESYLNFDRPTIKFNYSQIRAKGLPIRGFGGLASGPEPLVKLHKDIDKFYSMFIRDPGYDSVMLKTDISNSIGCCVVAGNVRRSAEIALGEISDNVFMDLKNYQRFPYRSDIGWMSNNSVYLRSADDFELLGDIAHRVLLNGEPGYINMINFTKGRLGHNDNLKIDRATGINPCQPEDAWVLTPEGLAQFKDIDVGCKIWSHSGWTTVVKKWSTGVKPTYKYITTAGIFYGTENHEVLQENFKVKVEYASAIDILQGEEYKLSVQHDPQSVMDGLIIGDGTEHEGWILLNIGKDDYDLFSSEVRDLIYSQYNKEYSYKVKTTIYELPNTYLRKIPEKYLKSNRSIVCSFLRGLYSTNGSICGNRITLKATSFDIIEQVQMMLSSIGIKSYWTRNKKSVVKFDNGTYVCKESYDLNISVDRKLFYDNVGFIQKYKTEKLEKLLELAKGKNKETYDIIDIVYMGDKEVFDITVDNVNHTYWTQCCNVSNCGEIPLESREVCNLAETFPTVCKDEHHWFKACEYATFYCSTVTLLPTHQQSTNAIVARNRRIGVGIVDFTGWKHTIGSHRVTRLLREGYKTVRSVNRWLAGEAGIPESIRVTTMKPGGTVPKLPGKVSGCGYPTFHHTLRRVRISMDSPVVDILIKAGYDYEVDFYSANTYVFSFPILQGPAKPATEVTLWEQAYNLILLQREWADNAVSNTLYFKPKWEDVKKLDPTVTSVEEFDTCYHVDDGYDIEKYSKDQYKIENFVVYKYNQRHEEDQICDVLSMLAPHTKSVSLLPHKNAGVYVQIPEEGITEEQYNEMLATVSKIDWSELRHTDGQDEKFCDGDKCIIP